MSRVADQKKREREDRQRRRQEERRERRDARRNRLGLQTRRVETRPLRWRCLIVCEGEKTEPHYFEAFPVNAKVEIVVEGQGMNTVSLVDHAVARRDEDGSFDEVWCVFDRDSFPAEHFNLAIDRAAREALLVAYSNEAFELWYLLHFCYLDAAVSRQIMINRSLFWVT